MRPQSDAVIQKHLKSWLYSFYKNQNLTLLSYRKRDRILARKNDWTNL